MYLRSHYLIYLYSFGGLSVLLGLKMIWSAFAPVDSYTKRLMGPEPLWGRALGILLSPIFLLIGVALIWVALHNGPGLGRY